MKQIIKRLLDLILDSRFLKRWMRGIGRDTSGSGCDMRGSGCDMRGSSCDMRGSSCDMRGSSCDMRDSDCEIIVPLPRLTGDPGGERPRVCVILVIKLHNYHLMEA